MLIVPKRSEEFENKQVNTDEEFSPSGTKEREKSEPQIKMKRLLQKPIKMV